MDKAFLRDVDLFSSLGDSELQEIADLSNLRQIPAGSAVVREGDTGDDLYIIKSGTLCVSAVQECGRDAKVGGLEASDGQRHLGEVTADDLILALRGGSEGGIGERVIREDAARELIYMMRQVVTRGTGGRAGLPDREIAGKTGTTQAARDAWFIGFSADYVAGVWMGYDDNTPLTGVTGSGLPAEIFHEVMARVHDGLPVHALPMLHPAPEPARTIADNGRGGSSGGGGGGLETAIERALKDIFGLN